MTRWHTGLSKPPTHTLMEARTHTQATVEQSLRVAVSLQERAERQRNEEEVNVRRGPERWQEVKKGCLKFQTWSVTVW